MIRPPLRLVALGLAAAFVVGACSSSDDAPSSESASKVAESVPSDLRPSSAVDTTIAVGDSDMVETSVAPQTVAKKIGAVATLYPIAWMVGQIGGDRVSVTNLTPPGVEPHDLELSPDQVEMLSDADVAIVMGRDFQPGPEKVAAKRSKPTIRLLDAVGAGDGKVAAHEEGEAHDHGDEFDPHVWLDPNMFSTARTEIVRVLSEVDPNGSADFVRRSDELGVILAELDAAMEGGLKTCERRTIVTAHEAFGRLASRYGLTQEGIAGLSPDAEPDPQRIADLSDLVRKQGITTVFFEELAPQNFADTLAREAGVKTAMLSPLEAPTPNELVAGSSYVTIMRANLTALRTALDCV